MVYNCNFLKTSLMALIRCYQVVVSSLLGPCCRFEPTCSQFAMDAIRIHGCGKGCYLAMKRLLRCHPWHAGGYDPVQEKNEFSSTKS